MVLTRVSHLFSSDISPKAKQTLQILLICVGFFASFVWDQDYNLQCGLISLGAVILALCLALPQRIALSWAPQARIGAGLVGIMAGLFVWTWIRALTSDVPATSIMAAGFYTTPLLVAAWVVLQHNTHVLNTTIRACLGLVAIVAVIGIGMAAYGDITGNYFRHSASRIDWPLQDANHYAMIMNVGLVAGLAAITIPSTRRIGIALSLLSWTAAVLAGSRAGTIALVIAVVVLGLSLRPAVQINVRAVAKVLGTGVIILLTILMVRPQGTPLVTNATQLVQNIDQSSGNRPLMWENTIRLALERPIWGYGTGTFIHVYPQTMTAINYDSGFAAHNDWIQIWLETGLPGALLYAGLGILIVVAAIKTKSVSRPEEQTAVRAASLAALTVLALHAQIEFMLMVMPVLILFGLALGVFVRDCLHHLPTPPQTRTVTTLPIGVLIILLSVLSLMQTQAQIATDRSNAALNRGDLKTFAVNLERASYYSIDRHAYPYLRTAHYQLAILMAGGDDLKTTSDDVQAAIDAALARNPYSSTTYDIQGRLDQFLGQSPEEAWVKGLTFEPRNADLRLSLLRLYERQGNTQKRDALVQSSQNWPHMRGQFTLLKDTLKRYDK